MNNKLCLSASALILGLMLSGSAFAQTPPDNIKNATADSGSSAATTGSTATTGSENGNADDSNNDNSNQGNADNSGQNNSTNVSKENGNTVDSGNTKNTDNSNQDNDSSQKNGNIVKSGNTVASNNAIGNKDNSGQNNSTNTDSSGQNNSKNVTATLSIQTLTETVTGTSVSARAEQNVPGSGVISTGNISLDGAAFAGIQTASSNTGIGNANQAATSLAANANISFGSAP